MNETEFQQGVAAARDVYPETRLLPFQGSGRPVRVAPVPIPAKFWGGGTTRLIVVFDLANHDNAKPRGLLGPEWKLPGGGAPHNASPVFEFGEAWQGFSWNFPWPPALGVVETIEAYVGRLSDCR